jgi:hypothetical protein
MEKQNEFASNEELSVNQLLIEMRPHFNEDKEINEDTVASKVEELFPHLSIADQTRLTEAFMTTVREAIESADAAQQ